MGHPAPQQSIARYWHFGPQLAKLHRLPSSFSATCRLSLVDLDCPELMFTMGERDKPKKWTWVDEREKKIVGIFYGRAHMSCDRI